MYGYTFCRYILLHHPILSESVNNVPVRCSAVYALRAAESIHACTVGQISVSVSRYKCP